MGRPHKLPSAAVKSWLDAHADWTETAEGALTRTFETPTYAAGLAFAVHLGVVADKRDHHPDLVLQYRRVQVTWTTHDAQGITELDLEMAALTDSIFE